MLTIEVHTLEGYDESRQKFVAAETVRLDLEHSLVSLSKWERIFKKPFLSKNEKTSEETLSYVQLMTLTPNVPPEVFVKLTQPENAHNIKAISDYINDSQTATTFKETPGPPNHEIITAELLHYWMIAVNIPFECREWPLGSLFALIRVCNLKQSPPKKMGRQELAQRNRDLNAQRKAQMGTTG